MTTWSTGLFWRIWRNRIPELHVQWHRLLIGPGFDEDTGYDHAVDHVSFGLGMSSLE